VRTAAWVLGALLLLQGVIALVHGLTGWGLGRSTDRPLTGHQRNVFVWGGIGAVAFSIFWALWLSTM
jgi:hypothetical protein